ncbi:hypothetical protein [Arthrobacter sp. efr-133-TYG-104]|uniref:hypothetical protein n=1 Tax=Arthrobacter sp. efr-133-TYG-104 TaxID=3040324 RepID=UPI00255027EC|nr:hypothetical protein [Arthrobacter sp. efr-133-TYG-104]
MSTESPKTPADVEPTPTGTVTGATTCVPEPIPPEPLVVAPELEPVAGVVDAAGPAAVEPPNTPTDDEPRFTGAAIGATTCVPEPMPFEPLVVEPAGAELEPAAGAVPAGVEAAGAEPADESPKTPADVEPTVTGTVTGATTCVAEPMPFEPLVVAPAGAEAAGVEAAGAELADESPSTPADVEPTVTGTVTGATTCVPEAAPFEPLVVAPAGAEAAGAVDDDAGPVAVEPPNKPTDDEPRFTGAVIGATTCVPEPMPLEPLVPAAGAAPDVPDGAAVPEVAVDVPRIPSEVLLTLTGAVTGATTWVPERVPLLPLVVSAALAAVALRTMTPPAKQVPIRHVRMVVFMVVFS